MRSTNGDRMKRFDPRDLRLSSWQIIAFAATAGAIACSDEMPTNSSGHSIPSAKSTVQNLIAVNCECSRSSLRVTCSSPGGSSTVQSSDGRRYYLVVGGQGQYIKHTSSAVSYTAADSIFQFDVVVQNLIPQP